MLARNEQPTKKVGLVAFGGLFLLTRVLLMLSTREETSANNRTSCSFCLFDALVAFWQGTNEPQLVLLSSSANVTHRHAGAGVAAAPCRRQCAASG